MRFKVININGDRVKILDCKDFIVEEYSRKEIAEFAKKIKIKGVFGYSVEVVAFAKILETNLYNMAELGGSQLDIVLWTIGNCLANIPSGTNLLSYLNFRDCELGSSQTDMVIEAVEKTFRQA